MPFIVYRNYFVSIYLIYYESMTTLASNIYVLHFWMKSGLECWTGKINGTIQFISLYGTGNIFYKVKIRFIYLCFAAFYQSTKEVESKSNS